MYSVLMETRDFANNSRIARRLVLFDDQSDITLNENPDGKLYVSSAVNETGYMWQTSSEGNDVTIDVAWSNHFINRIIEDNKLLYRVDSYPIQFKEIEDDGIRSSQKFVPDSLDDNEGNRTLEAIENFHGIVKFEVATVLSIDDEEPKSTWKILETFQEKTSIKLKLQEGSRVRVWVRATDVMGNIKTDSTLVMFDNTEPTISSPGDGHMFEPNIESTKFNFSSRIKFIAIDRESGVHKIGFSITIKTTGKEDRVIYEGSAPASISNSIDYPCFVIEGMCFKPYQNLYLDNCWFMVSKSDLDNSIASVKVYAYNQALLNKSVTFDIGPVKNLQGIEKYPENIRIESPTTDGFRVAWDIPKTASCYEKTETVLILLKKDGKDPIQTYYTSGSSKYYDITGLDSATEYQVNFGMKIPQAYAIQQTYISLPAETGSIEGPAVAESNIGLIIGVIVGIVVLLVVVIVVMIFLIRRGKRFRSVRRAITQRVRNTTHKGHAEPRGKMDCDNQESELYMFGGMDVQAPQLWHVNRNDITFEALIKNGHFANIYKARLKSGRNSVDLVVAKTLKEQFTPEDESLMKAKINFTVEKVGSHSNVLEFIGAVVHDDTMGPFMIYEYCENGILRDYLVERKDNVSMELKGNLFQFGLGIAKGMEFLSGKGIVHRRLAAQNILLNSQNEVKIYGFGPQSLEEEEEGDAEKGEMENKVLKWMAPECMESFRYATEKGDVWSFGVVLWEIFSLGDIPYPGKDIDLPKRLEEGERLEQPEHCDDTWYAVMKKCWSYEASKRPTFESVRQELDNLHTAANYVILINPDLSQEKKGLTTKKHDNINTFTEDQDTSEI
ncbi:angiopoietin-1 receptor-like [Ruditapes philippinarum]|uniref:angiopoietin-1 receptor-like n=1 Tax=Ruditapes philippinarum TaxID=129788 RepID=UPI00295B57FA|nr:angiopoietin-1 receptor-like [Ruditapes philippinarum]